MRSCPRRSRRRPAATTSGAVAIRRARWEWARVSSRPEDDEPARLTGLPRAKILRAHGAVKAARTPREPRRGRLVALSAANLRGRANRDENTEREAPGWPHPQGSTY